MGYSRRHRQKLMDYIHTLPYEPGGPTLIGQEDYRMIPHTEAQYGRGNEKPGVCML